MGDATINATYPDLLVDWAGHRSGGVRRLFDDGSGRPGNAVFSTNLLLRLKRWTQEFAAGHRGIPRILLLVGGPGNGKTEAIEATIHALDHALAAEDRIATELRNSFLPRDGTPVPRLVSIDLSNVGNRNGAQSVTIVQDATARTDEEGKSAAQLLLGELDAALAAGDGDAYLCCVNRGVLDDALIEAIETGAEQARELLEEVARAVGLVADVSPCWPLLNFPSVAVWPMDAESLITQLDNDQSAPARQLLDVALDKTKWLAEGECAAGVDCPFCGSRAKLAREREVSALLNILRWYEVGSGKRWTFRDLFSLTSYLLAGHQASRQEDSFSPCGWAKRLVVAHEVARSKAKPRKETSTALFQLVAAQYEHALFHRWDKQVAPVLHRSLKELGLTDDNTAMGLYWFLSSRRSPYLPATIDSLLEGVVDLLDPALVDPDLVVDLPRREPFALREVDARFSRSVGDGLAFVKKLGALSKRELELLERLAELDGHLSLAAVRKKRPAVAGQVQRIARDFACRLVRRSIGTKSALVRDASILSDYQRILDDSAGDDLYEVAREVERLLNSQQDFEISLTTTFGQPLPPEMRRATLVVPARDVRPFEAKVMDRPKAPIAFLSVGAGASEQAIALTYDLFKAIRELKRGMAAASLPPSVLALLDTTKARLSGPIVRDRAILDRASIRLGSGNMVVEQRRTGFAATKGRATR